MANLTNSEAMNFDSNEILQVLKAEIYQINKILTSKMANTIVLELLLSHEN